MESEILWGIIVTVAVILIFFKFGKATQNHQINAKEEDIYAAIKAGNKVHAIKYYRAVHHVSLKEAKKAVEDLINKV